MAKLTLSEVENGIRALRDVETYLKAIMHDPGQDWHAWNEVGATCINVLLQQSTEQRNQMIREQNAAAVPTDAA
jgi:hypothetical protein